MDFLFKLVEFERAVIIRRRQAEAVVDERLLARMVAVVHRAHLRQRHVAFVDKQQKIVREVVNERGRRGAGGAPGNDARVVFNARAEADFREHLEVILRPLADALRL